MTNTTYYRLTCEEWLVVSQALKLAELRVLYYLRTLDPFGDRPLDLKVVDIATAIGLTKGTVSKALRSLDCQGYIDLELVAVRVRLKSFQPPVENGAFCGEPDDSPGNLKIASERPDDPEPNQDRDSEDKGMVEQKFPVEIEVSCRKPELIKKFPTGNLEVPQETFKGSCKFADPPEPNQSNGFKNEPQISNVPIVLNKLVKQKQLVQDPPTNPVPDRNEQEKLGTFLQSIADSGIPLNKTIQKTVAIAVQQEGSAAAARIQKALSAVQEQQERGNCRNPGGLFIAAMRKGFTANELKGTKKPPPDLNTIALSITQALVKGDRPFALAKLQQLWADGWQDLVEELCILYKRDWQFRITNQGVQDGQ